MNTPHPSLITEDELRLRMDRRTVAQQDCEIRHIRQRLERLSAKQAIREPASEFTPRGKSLAA